MWIAAIHLLRFIPCTAVRPRYRKAPSIVLRALQDHIRFNKFKDKHAPKWFAALGLKIFKVQGKKTSGCTDRPAPSKVNAIRERSIRPFISLKKAWKRQHCTEDTCTYFLYGTISNTRLWKYTLLKAVCWFYWTNWKQQRNTKHIITFSSSCLTHRFLAFIPKRN